MVMEPMQGKLASSQFDLGHPDLFCVPEVTSVFFSSCDSVLGIPYCSVKQIQAPYMFGKTQLLCLQCRGIGPNLVGRGKSHWFSRVAAGTWGIFSS